MDVQLNIRCSEETATAIKALAESANLKLGALLEKLIASYQPDSAMIASDSSAIDELRLTVAALESRLSALESRPQATTLKNQPSKGATDPDQDRFKAAVLKCWNEGTRGYGPIATALTGAGFRNSNGNPYSREMVKRILVRAGLVA